MEIQQLQYFQTVCEEMNYTKAAERLFVTRQALSRSIHNLEEEIGQELFSFKDGRLYLTLAGEKLMLLAPGVLNSMNHLEEEMGIRKTFRKKLTIAIGQGTFTMLPIDLFLEYGKSREKLDVVLVERLDADAREILSSHSSDLAIMRTSPSLISMFDYYLLQQQTIYFRVHKDNPLAKQDIIHTADLATQQFASLGMRNDEHRFLVSECHRYGFEPKILLETGDAHSAGKVVLANEGIAFGFPEAEAVHGNPDIVLIPWEADSHDFGIYLLEGKHHIHHAEAKLLAEYLKKYLKNHSR